MQTAKTIKLTPTWRQAARIYIACLEDGTEEGKRQAREAILEMGDKLDAMHVLQQKDENMIAQHITHEQEQQSKEKHVTKTFGPYEAELRIEYDGDDLVSSCMITKGDYCSSLGWAEDHELLTDWDGNEIRISRKELDRIRAWAEDNGY